MRVLAQAWHVARHPIGNPVDQLRERYGRITEQLHRFGGVDEPALRRLDAGEHRRLAEPLSKFDVASQRVLICSGPLMLSGLDGIVQFASDRSTIALASPCQITLTCPAARLIGVPSITRDAMSCSTP